MNFPHLPFSRNCCMHRMTLLEPDENTRLRLALDRWRFTTAAALFAAALMAALLMARGCDVTDQAYRTNLSNSEHAAALNK